MSVEREGPVQSMAAHQDERNTVTGPAGLSPLSRFSRRALRLGQGRGLAGRLERGEIRLYRFERPDEERPVLILTRSSAIDYLSRVTVAPITSTIRGVPSEVALGVEDGMRQPCAANL